MSQAEALHAQDINARIEKAYEQSMTNARKRNLSGGILRWLVRLGAALTIAILLFILGFILINGIPYLTPSLFAWEYTSENVSLMPALINTLLMTALSLLFAAPIGVGAAIYLSEYARKTNKFVYLVRTTTEVLSGIPSIIYGLFGLLFFVTALHWGMSLLAGAATLAIMVLPIIMRTTEEALRAVPSSYREGSFSLGAGRLTTIFKIVLPNAAPGILGGIILSIGRVVGEVAALIYTAGTIAAIPEFSTQAFGAVFDSTRTLAVHMYVLASEGLHIHETYATAVVLLIVVAGINFLSTRIANKMKRG
ncbi:MAG: phosphate ABC transporter permease PstA [Raoultibacter sp.]|jgi:phosphate transport system permease protein